MRTSNVGKVLQQAHTTWDGAVAVAAVQEASAWFHCRLQCWRLTAIRLQLVRASCHGQCLTEVALLWPPPRWGHCLQASACLRSWQQHTQMHAARRTLPWPVPDAAMPVAVIQMSSLHHATVCCLHEVRRCRQGHAACLQGLALRLQGLQVVPELRRC